MCMRSALPHRTHVGFITNKKILKASVTIRPACMGVRYALPPTLQMGIILQIKKMLQAQ